MGRQTNPNEGDRIMRFYKVDYDSFEGHNTEIFFCNKAEAWKWVRGQRRNNKEVLSDPDDDGCTPYCENIGDPYPVELPSTKKRDIAWFINHYTSKS